MKPIWTVVFITCVLVSITKQTPTRAEDPLIDETPGINTVYPTAVQRGVATKVQFVGKRLEGATRLVAPFSAEVKPEGSSGDATRFLIKPAADTMPGVYPVRVCSNRGISNLRLIQVTDVPIIRVKRSTSEYRNGHLQLNQAQTVQWPAVIAGHRLSQDVDLFRFSVKAGQRLTIVTETRRLGLTPDPILWLRDSQGRKLTYVHDTPGLRMDERIDYTFKKAGDYFVELKSFGVSGWNNHYLLRIGDFDYARTVYPLGGRRGQKVRVSVLNREGRTSVIDTQVPSDRWNDRWRLSLPKFRGSLPWIMASGDLPELVEGRDLRVENRGQNELQAPKVDWPVTINGRISKPGEGDRYRIEVKPGQHIRVTVDAFYLGSHLDGYLMVYDPIAKTLLAKNDDEYYRGDPDPALTFEVPKETNEVVVELRDTSGKGGIEFPYRMTIERGGPDFDLRLGKQQTPYSAEKGGWYKMDPSDTLALPIGKEVRLKISARREAKQEPTYAGPIQGYKGAIRLKAINVPRGVTIKPGEIPVGKTETELVCIATTAAPQDPFEIVIVGEATRDDGTVIRRIAERRLFISDAAMTHLTWNLRVRKVVCVTTKP